MRQGSLASQVRRDGRSRKDILKEFKIVMN
jgi:hypothetical protein